MITKISDYLHNIKYGYNFIKNKKLTTNVNKYNFSFNDESYGYCFYLKLDKLLFRFLKNYKIYNNKTLKKLPREIFYSKSKMKVATYCSYRRLTLGNIIIQCFGSNIYHFLWKRFLEKHNIPLHIIPFEMTNPYYTSELFIDFISQLKIEKRMLNAFKLDSKIENDKNKFELGDIEKILSDNYSYYYNIDLFLKLHCFREKNPKMHNLLHNKWKEFLINNNIPTIKY